MSTLSQPPAATISVQTSAGTDPSAMPLRLTHTAQPQATSLSRQQIIQATAHCFRQDGYDGTTIRRIAKELNCAVGSIYRYFADKRELLSAVTQQAFEPLAQCVQAGEPIEESISEYRRLALADPVSYRLMFWLASLTPGNPGSLPAVIDRIIQGWTSQMESSQQAYNTWAYLHGVVTLPILSPSSLPLPTPGKPAAALRLAQPVRIDIPQEPASTLLQESADDVTML